MVSTLEAVVGPDSEFTFRPLKTSDLPSVVRWQASAAASPWFAGGLALEQANVRYGPRLAGTDPIRMFVLHRDGRDIGYAQTYQLSDLPDSALIPAPSDALGIDFLIGESDLVGHGIGSRLIVAVADFARWLFPGANQVVACPDHRNRASCRALEKAGFTAGYWFDAPSTLGGLPTTAIVYSRIWA